jgi:diadenosine tetraphosphate (Ap4A) HIT family hydrolase
MHQIVDRREGIVAVSGCIFCKIVAGAAECHELYRDDTTLAFMDIHPANEGHCRVIPRVHFETVQANGELAGQTVPHVHVHVLPLRAGDDLPINWDRNRVGDPVNADPVHLDALARRIRARLAE